MSVCGCDFSLVFIAWCRLSKTESGGPSKKRNVKKREQGEGKRGEKKRKKTEKKWVQMLVAGGAKAHTAEKRSTSRSDKEKNASPTGTCCAWGERDVDWLDKKPTENCLESWLSWKPASSLKPENNDNKKTPLVTTKKTLNGSFLQSEEIQLSQTFVQFCVFEKLIHD